MADTPTLLRQLDSKLDSLFSDWNIYTTILFTILCISLAFPLFFSAEPDVHPLLLARQATASPVRQPGESAVYRSHEVPHGFPLRTGLNVKDKDTPKWGRGRDGDLRDIWRQALKRETNSDGSDAGVPARIHTILGKDAQSFDLDTLAREICSIGKYLEQHNRSRIAILLPNSIEFLVAFFAAIFYNVTPVLISQGLSPENLCNVLRDVRSDTLIASAGDLPLEKLQGLNIGLKQIIWVAEPSSRHMDWHEVPSGVGGKLDIGVWHEILDEPTRSDAVRTDLPTFSTDERSPTDILFVTLPTSDNRAEEPLIVEMEQKNLVAAVAAQISALPSPQRFRSSDLFLTLCSLTEQYALVLTMAALYSKSSILLTSNTDPAVDYLAAFRSKVIPTIVLASPETLTRHLEDVGQKPKSITRRFREWQATRSLISGSFPKIPSLPPFARLIFTTQSADLTRSLDSNQLLQLRVVTGSRIVHALINPRVAGAVTQTHVYDYRTQGITSPDDDQSSHFGPPLSCLDIKLLETKQYQWDGDGMQAGHLSVEGPAVPNGIVKIKEPALMTITEQNTLAYVTKGPMNPNTKSSRTPV